jgi:MFS superfamily sulfate permease-like transporter
LTGVVGALVVALLLIAAPLLFRNLPTTALAAVVIAAAIGLFEFADLRRIYRIQQWEFWLSIACTVGVAVFGAIPGICLAIGLAIIEFLWDGWRPHSAVLGKAEGVEGYHDVTRYPEARRIPGLVLFRWDAPLFFANAELFCDRVRDAIEASPTKVRRVVVTAGAGHQRRCHLVGHPRRADAEAGRARHRALLCRDEGSGEGQAEALRPVRAAGRGEFLSHD